MRSDVLDKLANDMEAEPCISPRTTDPRLGLVRVACISKVEAGWLSKTITYYSDSCELFITWEN